MKKTTWSFLASIFYIIAFKGVCNMNAKRNVTPEKAVEILKKHGTEINIEEAKLMLDFLYKFAKLTLEIVLKR